MIEHSFEHLNSILAKHTCPVFYKKDRKFVPAGSSVLVKKQSDFFIFTAAHVVDRHPGLPFFFGTRDFVELRTDMAYADLATKTGDRLDMAIGKISSSEYPEFSGYKFSDIGAVQASPPDHACCSMLGFPLSKQKTRYNLKLHYFCYVSSLIPSTDYTSHGFDPMIHLCVPFDKGSRSARDET